MQFPLPLCCVMSPHHSRKASCAQRLIDCCGSVYSLGWAEDGCRVLSVSVWQIKTQWWEPFLWGGFRFPTYQSGGKGKRILSPRTSLVCRHHQFRQALGTEICCTSDQSCLTDCLTANFMTVRLTLPFFYAHRNTWQYFSSFSLKHWFSLS